MRIKNIATQMMSLWAPAEDGADLGGSDALSFEDRIASSLFDDGDADESDEAVDDDGDDSDLPEDDDVDDDEDADGSDEDETDDDESEVEDDDDQTLAAALGLPEGKADYDKDGNVVIKAVVDGKETNVKVSDLVKSYQLEGHVNNKSMKLESERKQFEEVRDSAVKGMTERVKQLNGLMEFAEKQLLSDYQGIDWQNLRVSDPAEYTALQQDMQNRANQIAQVKNFAKQTQDSMSEEKQQEIAQKKQEFVKTQVSKMIEDNPSWSDQEVMQKEFGEIGAFLTKEYGFSAEEIANSLDSRLMRLIQDARKYKGATKEVKSKQVKSIPKFKSKTSSSAQRKAAAKARQAKANKQALRNGGSTSDVAKLLIDRM